MPAVIVPGSIVGATPMPAVVVPGSIVGATPMPAVVAVPPAVVTATVATPRLGRRKPQRTGHGETGSHRRRSNGRAGNDDTDESGKVKCRHLEISSSEIAGLPAFPPLPRLRFDSHPAGTIAPRSRTSSPHTLDDGRRLSSDQGRAIRTGLPRSDQGRIPARTFAREPPDHGGMRPPGDAR